LHQGFQGSPDQYSAFTDTGKSLGFSQQIVVNRHRGTHLFTHAK
jgi:hypothetical protein